MNIDDPLGNYSQAEILRVLTGKAGARQFGFRYDLLDRTNKLVGSAPGVTSCTISYNSLADIKRAAKITLRELGAIDYLDQRIKPWVRLQMPKAAGDTRPGFVEWPQGVFLLATPTRSLTEDGTIIRTVDAYDQLLILRDRKVTNRFTVPADVFYTVAIRNLLFGLGFQLLVTTSPKLTPSAMEWDPGTSYLQIVNDLLTAINYESGFFDEIGRFVGRPYQTPAVRPSEITYATDSTSVITGDIDHTVDLFDVANQWVLVKSEADQIALRSVYLNTNPNSPTSTVSRGRTITDFRTEQDAADQATLDELAARLAFEASQVYEVVEFDTALMPIHSNADVYTVTVTDLDLTDKYSETTWSVKLEAGAKMSHRVRRVVSV